MFGAFDARKSLVQKSQFWTAIVRELPMGFASVSAGTRLDLAGWTIMLKEATAMIKEKEHYTNHSEYSGSARISRVKTYKTTAGPLFLRSCCSPSFVESLKADEGLRAFARLPEREHQLLLSIAQQPENRLTLAYNASGNIVGQVSLAPGDEWWEGLENVYEIAIEVSSNWRKMGVARNLLAFALELDALEDMILFAIGLS